RLRGMWSSDRGHRTPRHGAGVRSQYGRGCLIGKSRRRRRIRPWLSKVMAEQRKCPRQPLPCRGLPPAIRSLVIESLASLSLPRRLESLLFRPSQFADSYFFGRCGFLFGLENTRLAGRGLARRGEREEQSSQV